MKPGLKYPSSSYISKGRRVSAASQYPKHGSQVTPVGNWDGSKEVHQIPTISLGWGERERRKKKKEKKERKKRGRRERKERRKEGRKEKGKEGDGWYEKRREREGGRDRRKEERKRRKRRKKGRKEMFKRREERKMMKEKKRKRRKKGRKEMSERREGRKEMDGIKRKGRGKGRRKENDGRKEGRKDVEKGGREEEKEKNEKEERKEGRKWGKEEGRKERSLTSFQLQVSLWPQPPGDSLFPPPSRLRRLRIKSPNVPLQERQPSLLVPPCTVEHLLVSHSWPWATRFAPGRWPHTAPDKQANCCAENVFSYHQCLSPSACLLVKFDRK
ncbi:RNA-binding protein 25, partial [Ophiophagus hannah]